MTAYPYAGRNMLAEPESYEFASCEDVSFLESWRRAREAALRRFGERARGNPVDPETVEAPVPVGARRLHDVLESLLKAAAVPGRPEAADMQALDSLLQKFEIFRRLYLFYDDGMRKWPDAPLAGPGKYLLLAEVLGAWSDKTGKPRYLSTMLKAVDALCSLSTDELSVAHAGRLAAVIGLERRLVDRWIRVATE